MTATTISLSTSLRQWPTRCLIRAGRNLPDKEFRYLRTVIVTADIHGGLDPKLSPQALTFPHWSQVTPYTSTCVLAESCVFAKQSVGLFHCGLARSQAPLLPKLRGNFAEFLKEVSLTRLRILISDTCVGLRYGPLHLLFLEASSCFRFAQKARLNVLFRQHVNTTCLRHF